MNTEKENVKTGANATGDKGLRSASGVTEAKEIMRRQIGGNQPPEPIHDPSAWFHSCVEFGEMAGKGDTSKVGWFIDTAMRAGRGEILEEDAEKGYQNYIEARRKKAAALGRRLQKNRRVGTGSDAGVRISETRRIIALGALDALRDEGGGHVILHRALKVIKEDEEIRGEIENLLLKVARQQCRMPHIPMTEDNIKALLRPPAEPEKDKTEEEELLKELKRLDKIMKTFKSARENQDVKTARNSIQHRLDELAAARVQIPRRQVTRQGARAGGRKK